MSLFVKLQQRQAEGRPIRIGLIGAGKFGSMYLAQVPRTPGVHLVGIADLSPAGARANLERVGWDAQRLQALEHFLEPRWQLCRPSQSVVTKRYSDWVAYLAQRAAVSAPGRSLRQLERRIKHWSGLPMRELRVMGRSEEAFFATAALATQNPSKLDWAQIAADTGYSDQSHMIRTTRRITGFTPEALGKGIQHQESFWAYRLWM